MLSKEEQRREFVQKEIALWEQAQAYLKCECHLDWQYKCHFCSSLFNLSKAEFITETKKLFGE